MINIIIATITRFSCRVGKVRLQASCSAATSLPPWCTRQIPSKTQLTVGMVNTVHNCAQCSEGKNAEVILRLRVGNNEDLEGGQASAIAGHLSTGMYTCPCMR